MRSRALLLLAAALPAAEPPVIHWSVDDGAVAALAAQEPFALLRDPRAATAAAHAAQQLRMMGSDPHVPPFLDLLGLRSARLWGWMPERPVQALDFSAPVLGMRLEGAVGPFGRWVAASIRNGGSGELAGLPAKVDPEGVAFAHDEARWLAAKGPMAAAVVADAGPVPAGARLHLEAAAVVRAASAAVSPGDAAEVDAVMPRGWRTWAPVLDLALVPGAPAFTATGALSGLAGLPLAAIDPDLAALIPAEAEIAAAAAVEPGWLQALIPVIVAEAVPRRQRKALTALLAPLSGQAVLWAGWGAGPIPEATLVLSIDPAGAEAFAAALPGIMPEAEPTQIAGADAAWIVSLPFGALTIARAGSRLVLALDAGAGLAAMPAAAARPAAIPAGTAVWVRADAPAIGRRWLPTAWALAQAQREPLGPDPVMPLRMSLWGIDEGVVDGTPAALLLANEDEDSWKAKGLRTLFGDAAGIDRRVALHRDAGGELVAVLRTGAAAWIVIRRHGEGLDQLDAAGLAAALDGGARIAGPEAAAIEAVAIPERAVFDRRWLPPVDVAVAHLRPWQVVATHRPDGLQWREEGLPVLTTLAVVAAHGTWILGGEAERQAERRIAEAQEQRFRQEQPDLMAALDHIQAALSDVDRKDLPLQAAGLVGHGVELDRLGALWGDGQPGPAADLDRMGRWTPQPGQGPGTIWLIRIDATWAAAFGRWGGLNLVRAPADLPRRPAIGQPPVPMAP